MAAEKSLIVQGRTMEEALQRAALLLHCPLESIGHEVLGEPSLDHGNSGRTHYKLRVIPLAPSPEIKEAEDALTRLVIPIPLERLAALSSEQFLYVLGETIAAQPALRTEPAHPEPHPFEALHSVIGAVTTATGSIRHHGDVVITGDVKRGASVHAAGSITIHGDVEAAILDAGNDIRIDGGMLGTARSARGGIRCRYAQGANMVCAGRLVILESAVHCTLVGGEELEIGEAMIGGSAYARRQMVIGSAGSESGTPTQLTAGMNRALREDVENVRRQAARLVEKLGAYTSVIARLSPSEEKGVALPIDQRIEMWNALSEKTQINDKLLGLSRTKNLLIARINADHAARVKISDRVYPPTQIEIDDVGMTVKALTQYATFTKDYEADLLRITPFQ